MSDRRDHRFVLLLSEVNRPSNLPFPHLAYEKFSLACKADFRVEKRDINPLSIDALRVPPGFQCYNGTICDGVEGLCIMLKRDAGRKC